MHKVTGPRCAIVTGGARGIGADIAHQLAGTAYWVAIFDRDRSGGEMIAAELEPNAGFFKVDVSEESSVQTGVQQVLNTRGRIDALVNNAGISAPFTGPVETLSLQQWNRVLGTNLTGCFLCTKHAVPALRRHGTGAIVNVASTRAFQSEPETEAYAASKGGLVALTHALAISLGPSVRVNCVSPGWIDTGGETLRRVDHAQHPAGRVGRPADVAALTAFLLSQDAGFITGQNFIVDGGMMRKMIYAE
jgi:NAD(P)-dependent dehydrogenase (short-subunit alcohol dehydrogenase family)